MVTGDWENRADEVLVGFGGKHFGKGPRSGKRPRLQGGVALKRILSFNRAARFGEITRAGLA